MTRYVIPLWNGYSSMVAGFLAPIGLTDKAIFNLIKHIPVPNLVSVPGNTPNAKRMRKAASWAGWDITAKALEVDLLIAIWDGYDEITGSAIKIAMQNTVTTYIIPFDFKYPQSDIMTEKDNKILETISTGIKIKKARKNAKE